MRDMARKAGGTLTEAFLRATGGLPLLCPATLAGSPSPHSALNLPRTSEEILCFPLSSPSTEWGPEGLPTLLPLPPCLPLPVQPMGVGVWLSPGTRIISSVMYIQTHALLLGRTRRGEGARAAGRRGFITRLLNLNLSPPRMGVLMAPEDPAPRKSITVQAGSLRRPSLLSSHSLRLWPGTASHPFTSAASAALGAVTGPLDLKCPDIAPLGAAAGRWGAPEQGLECASEGMATGIMSRRCWLRLLGWGRGRVKPVTQRWSNGGLGGGCHVSKWLQLQILFSVGPNGCLEIKPWVCVRPSARAPQMGEGSPSRGLIG